MLWLFHADVAGLAFRDPDDAMRLQQVRDWIAGQSFFDVSQHRVNPPAGGPMHWSRIVDLPIMLIVMLVRPLLGVADAERIACLLVPLLLLGAVAWSLLRASTLMGGRALGLLAVALLLTAPSILVQFTPLRIDHHGWQIAMAALALCGALDPRARRGGVLAGLALAVWLQISSEGLPYAALIGAVFALRQWFAREEAPRLTAYAAILGGMALLLLVLLKGWQAAFASQCDALSFVYVWPLAALGIATPVAARLLGCDGASRRLAVAAIGGGAAVATFALTGGPCIAGDPFAALGPVAYRLWYLQVMEGRPIWEQTLPLMGIILLPPLAGLAGTLAAARLDAGRRAQWLTIAALLTGATLVALMVMRAMSVAHLFALPGIAWLLSVLFRRLQSIASASGRVLGSVALVLLTPVGLCALWIGLVPSPPDKGAHAGADCRSAAVLAPLATLPDALLFAPLDMGPDILVRTGHSVIGTAHHRNAAGITAVIEGFTQSPEQASRIVARMHGGRGADYVVTCAGLNEMTLYAKASPDGLAARLARGNVPTWLEPLPVKPPLHLYRVVGPSAAR